MDLDISSHTVIEAFLPIGSSTYWFATDYVILMIVSPWLNVLLHRLSRQQLLLGLILITIIWSVLPCILTADYGVNYLVWCLVLYIYAGYIRLYGGKGHRDRLNLYMGIAAYGVVIASDIIMLAIGHITGIELFIDRADRLSEFNSPFILLSGIGLLLYFLKLPPRSNRIVNMISSATFGVYLIHDHHQLRVVIWNAILGMPDSIYSKNYLPLHMILSVIVIFALCVVIDLIRQRTVEHLYMAVVDRIQRRIVAVYERHLGRIEDMMDRLLQ